MIWLTRFDGTQFVINAALIEMLEATPDTVITLTNGHRFVVREGLVEIVQQIVSFQQRVYSVRGVHE